MAETDLGNGLQVSGHRGIDHRDSGHLDYARLVLDHPACGLQDNGPQQCARLDIDPDSDLQECGRPVIDHRVSARRDTDHPAIGLLDQVICRTMDPVSGDDIRTGVGAGRTTVGTGGPGPPPVP